MSAVRNQSFEITNECKHFHSPVSGETVDKCHDIGSNTGMDQEHGEFGI